MAVLGIDLGGTKLALAVFSEDGTVLHKQSISLDKHRGKDVALLIINEIKKITSTQYADIIHSIGIGVPGISHQKSGTVWAPNIPGWDDYPLAEEIQESFQNVPVTIDSDRACYISGELWKGNAQGCKDAIYLAVGTGIGAGILVNGNILRGAHDIGGAIGWLALDRPFKKEYIRCGCFEYHASGEGIAKVAKELLLKEPKYTGELKSKLINDVTAHDVFTAYEKDDDVSKEVLKQCVEFWGMAVANLISLFNPEKIILGGGVFGPAVKFISAIQEEAKKWAQPISMNQVKLESSKLGGDAGLFGAGFFALQALGVNNSDDN